MAEREAGFRSPQWKAGEDSWALSDTERHLGYTCLDNDSWLAWDSTHANAANDGVLCLGRFPDAASARRAIEQSVGVVGSLIAQADQGELF